MGFSAAIRRPPRMDIRLRVGANLKALRVQRKLTQEDVSGLAQVDQTYLSGVENGKRNPSISMLQKLADALGVDPAELVRPLVKPDHK